MLLTCGVLQSGVMHYLLVVLHFPDQKSFAYITMLWMGKIFISSSKGADTTKASSYSVGSGKERTNRLPYVFASMHRTILMFVAVAKYLFRHPIEYVASSIWPLWVIHPGSMSDYNYSLYPSEK